MNSIKNGTTSAAVSATASTPIERPLTASELAPLIHLHRETILKWARENRIPHRRLGARKIVFVPSEINRWLSSGYAGDAVRAA
jgi:excisionase family DNA binding protein